MGHINPEESQSVAEPTDASASKPSAQSQVKRVSFWELPSEDVGPLSAWGHFRGREHMKGVAQLWAAGLRFSLGEPGIPLQGVTGADLQAARCVLVRLK
jgi:hypothetical protein